MTILDYGDVLYMHASSQSLRSFDTVYHGSLMVLKSSLTVVMCMNMLDDLLYQCGDFNTGISFIYIYIYKGILGLRPSYLLTYISVNNIGTYNLRSQDFFLLSVPKVRTELGKKRRLSMPLPLHGTSYRNLWNLISWSHWLLLRGC